MKTHSSFGQVAPEDRAIAVERLAPLLALYNAGLTLFGSRARGDARERSDIDLAVVAAERLPGDALAAMRETLEEAPIPFRVDVVDYRAASPELRQAIDREGISWIA